jgi:hypothetical protein
MLGEIGTLEWTRRTNGLLSRPERARYLAAVVREQVRVAPRLLAFRLGRSASDAAAIEPEALTIPDSSVAQDAVLAARAVQPRTVVAHSYRSFVFARALGAAARIHHDPEVLFVATMFHDQGVATPDTTDGGRCFTLRGADDAEAHLAAAGRSAEDAAKAAEAITLHVNPAVPLDSGPEAHLMHDGVLLDLAGVRAWELRRDGIERVRALWPRERFTQEGRHLLSRQARAIPQCRAAAAFRAGFGVAIGLSPWRD